jgi:hypothetical protein
VFDFNVDIASVASGVGNAGPPICDRSSVDPSHIVCNGQFAAGQTYVYAMETVANPPPCTPAQLFFDPTVDERPRDRVGCGG